MLLNIPQCTRQHPTLTHTQQRTVPPSVSGAEVDNNYCRKRHSCRARGLSENLDPMSHTRSSDSGIPLLYMFLKRGGRDV